MTETTDYTVVPIPSNLLISSHPETTIRRMLWDYPTLFQSRTDAVYHLLYIGGNGYEWDGGELVEVFDRRERDQPSSEVIDPGRVPDEFTSRARAERDAEYAAVRSDLETAATTWGEPHRAFRPEDQTSQYTPISQAPNDVTAAWAALIAEARTRMPAFFAEQARADAAARLVKLDGERATLLRRLAEIDEELAAVSSPGQEGQA